MFREPIGGSFTVEELLERAIAEHGLDDEQANAVRKLAWHESKLDPHARNPKSSATGVFQFIDSTGAAEGLNITRGPDDDRFNPVANINAGIKHFLKNYQDTGSIEGALGKHYNSGNPDADAQFARTVLGAKRVAAPAPTPSFVEPAMVSSADEFVEPATHPTAPEEPAEETFIDPMFSRETGELIGKGLGWLLSRPREWVVEPTIGRAYDFLAPLVGAPTEKGWVKSRVSLESMLRPGEFGQTGLGESIEGEANMYVPTLREMLLMGAETSLLGAANRFKDIKAAYRAGQRTVPLKTTPKGRTLGPISPVDVMDKPHYGVVVYQPTMQLRMTTDVGQAGQVVGKFPFRQKHVELRTAAESAEFRAPKFDTLETGEALWDRIDDALPGAKEFFYYDANQALTIGHKRSLLWQDALDVWKNKLGNEGAERAGIWALSQRVGGPERLAKSGKKTVGNLTADETAFVQWVRDGYDDVLPQLNRARIMAGKQPIPKDTDYITFMTRFNELAPYTNPVLADYRYFLPTKDKGLRFPWEKSPTRAGPIETDLSKIFGNYIKTSERYIATAPTVGKVRQFTDSWKLPDGTKLEALSDTNPSLSGAMNRWADQVAGIPPAENVLGRWASDVFHKVSNNIAIAIMSAYPKSMLNQTGALAFAAGEAGPINLLKGIVALKDPENWKRIRGVSDVLASRRMDVSFEEIGGGFLKGFMGNAQHTLMKPLEWVDDVVATAAGLAAEAKGISLGLQGRRLTNYIDDVIVRTQGFAAPTARSYIQASKTGKALTTFQTFTIAEGNWITRHLLGINNPNLSRAEQLKKLGGTLSAGFAITLAFKGLGISPPFPDITKAWEVAEAGGGVTDIALEMGKEMLSQVPLMGGLAIGATPGGPAVSGLVDVASGKKHPLELAFLASGVPAGGVLSKLWKSQPGIEARSELERLTGLPIGPRGKARSVPPTVYEALMGREHPYKHRRTPTRLEEMFEK